MADKAEKRPILVALISVGAVGVILIGLFLVGIDTKNVAKEVMETRAELKSRINQLNQLAQLREEARLAQSKMGSLENLLPKRDELFSFPTRVESLADSHGLSISFTFGNEAAGAINYSIVVQGPYGEIANFLDSVERDLSFMSVTNMDINAQGGVYRANISGKVFFDE